MIDYLREGIHHALIDVYNSGTDPVLHPEGFAQIVLDPPVGDWKVHVWSNKLPRVADADVVHDHAWNLTSTVLRGTQVNVLYMEDEEGLYPGGRNYDLYVAQEVRHSTAQPGAGGKELVCVGKVRLIERAPLVVPEGESYSMRRQMFHKSMAEPGTATLMHKQNRLKIAPRVAALPGQRPDAWSEVPPPTANELIDIMVEVLDGGY